MKFHLRLTPPILLDDWSFMSSKKSIVAFETSDKGVEHYHILIDEDTSRSTLRKWVLDKFEVPPGGMGKNNKYYSLIENWKDPSYIVKNNDIKFNNLFSEDELKKYVEEGKKYIKETVAINAVVADTVVHKESKDEFSKLLATWLSLKRANYTMANIRNWIKSYYLQQCKCIPRSGDLARYTYSIFAISTNADTEECQDQLTELADRFNVRV